MVVWLHGICAHIRLSRACRVSILDLRAAILRVTQLTGSGRKILADPSDSPGPSSQINNTGVQTNEIGSRTDMQAFVIGAGAPEQQTLGDVSATAADIPLSGVPHIPRISVLDSSPQPERAVSAAHSRQRSAAQTPTAVTSASLTSSAPAADFSFLPNNSTLNSIPSSPQVLPITKHST